MAKDTSPSSGSWIQGFVFLVFAALVFWLALRSFAPNKPLMPGVQTPEAPTVSPVEATPPPAEAPAAAAPTETAPATGGGAESWQ
jgi:cytoskeletal protein RodZ